MSPAFSIHHLGPGDVARLRALNALFTAAFEDRNTYAGAPPDDRYLARTLAKEHVIVLVALEADAVVGGLVAYQLDKLEQARSEVYIYDLAVHADHRRQGIASALIGSLQSIAAARGAWVIYVQADHGDGPAVALYEKLGIREDVMHFDIPVPIPQERPGKPDRPAR